MPVQTLLEQQIGKGALFVPPGKIRCNITGNLYNDTEHERNLQTLAKRLVREYNYKYAQLARKFLRIQIGSKHYYPDIVAFHENLPQEKSNIQLAVEIEPEKN